MEPQRESAAGAGARAGAAPHRIVVVGHAARDLVLRADGMPDAGGSTTVTERIERLGGKGANTAVGIRQLDPEAVVTLIAALGADPAGDAALQEAADAGIDVTHVARRGRTALLVDLVTADGERRLLEEMPDESFVTREDVDAAGDALRSADIVVLQLQEPGDALVAAARLAHEGGARIVIDGAIEGDARETLLSLATVVRADAQEAPTLTGVKITGRDDAERAAADLLERGAHIVALAVPDEGDLVAWRGGSRLYPHGDEHVVDPTGAGDAFVAGLATGLARGDDAEQIDAEQIDAVQTDAVQTDAVQIDAVQIGQLAAAAATATVQRLGGHPELAHLRDAEREAGVE